MIGIVYTDNNTDKLIKFVNGSFATDIPANIHVGSEVLNVIGIFGFLFFKNNIFTSKNVNLFRFVNVNIISDDNFNIYETPTSAATERMVFVSSDDAHIVAYRSGTYQVVTTASLVTAEIINLGALSFTDMQTVMTQANTLTSPQIKYIMPVGNDTVSFTEIV